tara:strand:+ start:2618 stop:2740 length:123 start_codon:yes stop_codon:yes gene_type:complete
MEINKIADPGPDRIARMRYVRVRALSPVSTGELCDLRLTG